ncbi:cysQ protein [Salmonella enterica subsp. enterica]|uniref:CysQ protein n=1 Tax=Salmonella enterica I TaxID=59201 RepID=A0A3S4LNP5_SALET|nr:cysQ protein [Salmonella enterica subsp. enterica]
MLGVVYAPVLKVMYYAAEGKAWKEECGVRKQIQVRDARPPLVVISRSHTDDELTEYLQQLGETSDNLYWFLAEILPCGGRPGAALPQIWADQRLGHCRRSCHCRCSRGARSRLAGKNAGLYPS